MFQPERRAHNRPEEERMIRAQERRGMNSSEIIESQKERAEEALKNFRLIAALQGESMFKKITLEHNADVQIELASSVIHAVPFVLKYIPDHLSELPEQAGFIVAVAKTMSEPDQNVH